jgi:hypothetical protein
MRRMDIEQYKEAGEPSSKAPCEIWIEVASELCERAPRFDADRARAPRLLRTVLYWMGCGFSQRHVHARQFPNSDPGVEGPHLVQTSWREYPGRHSG